ncbi:hypothetical protein MP228_011941 [Amoeboaphelidium protococcarum]|nr:hypothetical protein MP228_011941 [Amoeboaphelidium protococcarum]
MSQSTVGDGAKKQKSINAAGQIESIKQRPERMSTLSYLSIGQLQQSTIKDGFLNRKTEHLSLNPNSKHPSSGFGRKQWKVNRTILRGSKLYFFKLSPELTALTREMFSENNQNGSSNLTASISLEGSQIVSLDHLHHPSQQQQQQQQSLKQGKSPSTLRKASTAESSKRRDVVTADSQTVKLSSESLTNQGDGSNDNDYNDDGDGSGTKDHSLQTPVHRNFNIVARKGKDLQPDMVDGTTRLILFKSHVQDGEDRRLFNYADVFVEVDLKASPSGDLKLKQQLCLVVTDSKILLLPKRWVRITKSIDVTSQFTPAERKAIAAGDQSSQQQIIMMRKRANESSGSHSKLDIATAAEDSSKRGSLIGPLSPNNDQIMKKIDQSLVAKFTYDGEFEIESAFTMSDDADGSLMENLPDKEKPFLFGLHLVQEDSSVVQRYFKAKSVESKNEFLNAFDQVKSYLLSQSKGGQFVEVPTLERRHHRDSDRSGEEYGLGNEKFISVTKKHPSLAFSKALKLGTNAVIDSSRLLMCVQDDYLKPAFVEALLHESLLQQVYSEDGDNDDTELALNIKLISSRLLSSSLWYSDVKAADLIKYVTGLLHSALGNGKTTIYIEAVGRLCQLVDPIQAMSPQRRDQLKVLCQKQKGNLEPNSDVLNQLKDLLERLNQEATKLNYSYDQSSVWKSLGDDGLKLPISDFLQISVEAMAQALHSFSNQLLHSEFDEGLLFGMYRCLWDGEYLSRHLSSNLPLFLQTLVSQDDGDKRIFMMHALLNPLSQFIKQQVLVQCKSAPSSKRAALLTFWIRVGEILKTEYGNSYLFQCIAEVMWSPPIVRLTESWKLVDPKYAQLVKSDWISSVSGISQDKASGLLSLVQKLKEQKLQLLSEEKSQYEIGLLLSILDSSLVFGKQSCDYFYQTEDKLFQFVRKICHQQQPQSDSFDEWQPLICNFPAKIDELYELSQEYFGKEMEISFSCEGPHQYATAALSSHSNSMTINGFDNVPLQDGHSFYQIYIDVDTEDLTKVAVQKLEKDMQVTVAYGASSTSKQSAVLKQYESGQSKSILVDDNFEVLLEVSAGKDGQGRLVLRAVSLDRLMQLLIGGITSIKDIKMLQTVGVSMDKVNDLDKLLIHSYLSVYRTFQTPIQLLEVLKRLWSQCDKESVEAARSQKRGRILQIIEFWLKDHRDDFMDSLPLQEGVRQALSMFQKVVPQKEAVGKIQSKFWMIFYEPFVDDNCLTMTKAPSDNINLPDFDSLSVKQMHQSLQLLVSRMYQQVGVNDWFKLNDVISLSMSQSTLSHHQLSLQIKQLQTSSDDHTGHHFSLISLEECLSLIQVPVYSYSADSSTVKQPTTQTARRNVVSRLGFDQTMEQGTVSSTYAPLITAVPQNLQSIHHFQQNLVDWTIHCIVSASSGRLRVVRLKKFIELARLCRDQISKYNLITDSIIHALVSPQSRCFGKSWQIMTEMPLEGIELKLNKSDRDSVAVAETYMELLEALHREQSLVSSKSSLSELVGQIYYLSPLCVFSILCNLTLSQFDEYFIHNDGKKLKLSGNYKQSQTAGGFTKAISANQGLPLINIGKRLQAFQLIQKLGSRQYRSSFPDYSIQGGVDELLLSFLLVPSSVHQAPGSLFDYDSAISAANRDNERVKVQIALFKSISDQLKVRHKLKLKEFKKLQVVYEKDKDREKSRSPSRPTSSIGRPLKDLGALVGSGSSPMLNNLLRTGSQRKQATHSVDSLSGNTSELSRPVSAEPSKQISSVQRKLSAFKSVPELKVDNKEKIDVASLMKSSSNIRDKSANSSSQYKLDKLSPSPSEQVFKKQMESSAFSLEDRPLDPKTDKPIKVVSLMHSRSHVASDYARRNYVFRILTDDDQEILLQAASQDEMFDWIRKLNEASFESLRKMEDSRLNLIQEAEPVVEVASNTASQQSLNSKSSANTGTLGRKQSQIQSGNAKDKLQPNAVDAPKRAKSKLAKSTSDQPKVFKVPLMSILQHELAQKEVIAKMPQLSGASRFQSLFKKKPASATVEVQDSDITARDPSTIVWDESNSLPLIVEKCLAEIEARGLTEIGIYRLSGSNNAIKDLRNAFDADPFAVNLKDKQYGDINVISGVLKMFLREMPEPLLTFDLFDRFMAAAELVDYNDRLIAIKTLVHSLPRPNFYILKRLIEHLQLVTDYEETNHMYASNLAIVFGTNVCRPPPVHWYQHRANMSQNASHLGQQLQSGHGESAQPNQASDHPSALGDAEVDNNDNLASTMQHLGKCTTIVKNMILQAEWLFMTDEEYYRNEENARAAEQQQQRLTQQQGVYYDGEYHNNNEKSLEQQLLEINVPTYNSSLCDDLIIEEILTDEIVPLEHDFVQQLADQLTPTLKYQEQQQLQQQQDQPLQQEQLEPSVTKASTMSQHQMLQFQRRGHLSIISQADTLLNPNSLINDPSPLARNERSTEQL